MSLWSDGDKWEPSGQVEPSLWGGVDAGVGWPDVIVDGIHVEDRCTALSWSSGRTWWLADPEPGTASITLQGTLAGELAGVVLGDVVQVAADPVGSLWKGWIDSIVEVTDPVDGELAKGLQITAVDALSRILSVELYSSLALIAGDLVRRLNDLAIAAGVPSPQVVTVLPTTGVLPQLAAVTLAGSSAAPLTLSDHLAQCERASNAIVAVARDGSWLILPRARVLSTPPVVSLDPNHLDRMIATPERVRNVFTLAGALTTFSASIGKYGRRAYDVPAGLTVGLPPYAPETLAAFAEPAPFAGVTVPVRHRTAAAVALNLFDWCRITTRPTNEYYQALAMSWTATPDEWSVGLELDRTQMTIAAPPIDPDPPDPPNPIEGIATTTFLCDRSAYVVQAGGLNAGNGGSVDMLVGRLGDGNLARGLVRFNLAWAGPPVEVLSAKLRLRGGQTTCSGYGGSPATEVQRLTGGWSPGAFATRCAFSSTNAVVFPGPAATSAGQVTKAGPKAEGQLYEVDVTAIVQAWASGSPNYGVRLRAANEGDAGDRAPYWSRHAGASGDRPTLVVNYTYEVR